MYLWTSVAYLFTYVCTRLSISHWYRRPPSVDESMVVSFCSGMTAILALNLLVQAFGCFAQGTSLVDGLPVYLLSPIVWLAYVLAPLERCFPVLRPYVDELEPDTDGIAYDDVPRIKKYEMGAVRLSEAHGGRRRRGGRGAQGFPTDGRDTD